MLVEIIQRIGKFIMDIIEVIVISMSIFIVVYLFLMQPHQVKGSSMYPTFYDGEFLMTDKVSYKLHPPRRGDVVVFKSPIAEDFDFIKRVLAVPGDRIMVKQNRIWLNGKVLDEPYLPKDYVTQPGNYLREGVESVVPPNSYMTIGDNRGHSSDSREWGPVPIENFIGKGLFRYYPFPKFWLVQHYSFGGDGQ
jgi:signal peptidase I